MSLTALGVKAKPLASMALLFFLVLSSGFTISSVSAAASANLTEWTLPDGGSGPWGIGVDFNSKIWFTENQSNRIGSLDPVTFSMKEWDIPTGGSNPRGIFIKPAATSIRVYFTEYSTNKVGYFDNATQTFFEWTLPNDRKPVSIAVDDNDNMWFTESQNDAIGKLNPIGNVLTEYKLPTLPAPAGTVSCGSVTAQLCPWGIAVKTVHTVSGTNVIVWFTEFRNNVVGRMEGNSGVVTLFNLGTINPIDYLPMDITLDTQGNAIFTSVNDASNRISIIRNSTSTVADLNIPTSQAKATGIRWDASRNVAWFTEYRSGKLANVDTSNVVFQFLPNVIQCTIGGSNPGAPNCASGSGISQPATSLSTTTKSPKITNVTPSLITSLTPLVSNQFTEYPLPTTTSGPNSVAVDSGGNVWFTEQTSAGNRIARMTIITPFDFSLAVSPSTVTVKQGQSANYTITVSLTGGSTATVTLSLPTSPPAGITYSFTAPTGNPTFTSQLTLGTTASTAVGTYPMTLQASGGGVTKSATINLIVSSLPPPATFDFSLEITGSSAATVTAGDTATFSLQVSLLGTTSAQSVQLFATGQPSGVTATVNPSTGLPPFTATLVLTSSSQATAGTYSIDVTGTGGGQSKQVTVTLTLTSPERDFTIDVTPNSLSMPQASSGTATVTVQSVGVFADPVTLATSNLPGGISASFTQNPVTPSQGGTAVTTVTLTVSRSVGAGTYSFTVTGTSGSLVKQATMTVSVTGCVIATATYGSKLSPEVQFLRNFRDTQILETFAGSNFMRAFNAWYYSYSPTVANYISTHDSVKVGMRYALYPLIGILHVSSNVFSAFSFAPELAALVAGLVASSMIGLVYLALPISGILWLFKRKLNGTSGKTAAKWLARVLAAFIAVFVVSEFLALASVIMLLSVGIMLTALAIGSLLPALAVAQFRRNRH
jgi:streptogramin lyase